MPLGKRKRVNIKSQRKRLKTLVQSVVRKNIETSSVIENFIGTSIVDAARVSGTQDKHLTFIAQGTGEGERIKNEIRVTGIYGDLFVKGADTTNSMRLILYIPKDKGVTLSNSPGLPFNAAIDLDQYTILKDILVTTSAAGPDLRRIRLRYKFRGRGLRVGYSGSSGSTVSTHPLYFYMVSDSTAVTDPTIDGYIRTYYKDG